MFEYKVSQGEAELGVMPLEWTFGDLPFFESSADMRIIANSVCTFLHI